MKKSITNYVSGLNRRNFTNNKQRVPLSLIKAAESGDGWVSSKALRVPSAGSRVRDLRLPQNGGFSVDCKSASELGRNAGAKTFFYRITQRDMTVSKLRQVFGQ